MNGHEIFKQTLNTYLATFFKTNDSEKKIQISKEIQHYLLWGKNNTYITDVEYNQLLSRLRTDSHQSIDVSKSSRRVENKYRDLLNNLKSYLSVVIPSILSTLIILYIYTVYILPLVTHPKNAVINPDRVFAYQGVLKNSKGEPITIKTDLYFRLYKAKNDILPFYEGACLGSNAITPNHLGEFTVMIGKECDMKPILQSMIPPYGTIYLGISVGRGKELNPRILLSSDASAPGTFLSAQQLDTGGNLTQKNSRRDELLNTQGDFSISALKVFVQTTSAEIGDIIFQPFKNTLFPTGNVYIGSKPSQAKLSVNSDTPSGLIASFQNDSLEDDPNSSVLNLGVGTPKSGKKTRFITFTADGGNAESRVGSIRLKNGGVVYETRGADFAEYFNSEEGDWEDGDMVGLSGRGIVKASRHDVFIGVVSSRAGFIGNAEGSSHGVLVGLKGQVAIKTRYDQISPSDGLCLSDISGIAQKCKQTDAVVAYALNSTAQAARIPCSNESDQSVSNDSCLLMMGFLK